MLVFGAWPVLGFMGLDIWLLWFLCKRSFLDARHSETLLLTDRELIIDRVAEQLKAALAEMRAPRYEHKLEIPAGDRNGPPDRERLSHVR